METLLYIIISLAVVGIVFVAGYKKGVRDTIKHLTIG